MATKELLSEFLTDRVTYAIKVARQELDETRDHPERSRELSLALTKLEEAELWLQRATENHRRSNKK